MSVVHYELLKPSETITSNRNGAKLLRLTGALNDIQLQYNKMHGRGFYSQTKLDPTLQKLSRHT